ncbi:CLUMA_CG000721, isoform A [Clunio marinus]|uniref:Putative hydroxypyruvate isomerase n=1 Tax=Clunio marinus TaxID=568069 RepID=A0A1J1HGA0_9DIPT|nr:CLUMA_CG000721, isoform A [Clunio marinus]
MVKFSANLGFLFLEAASIVEQYQLAKQYGFKAVEHPFPAKHIDHQKLLQVKKDLNLEVTLVNIDTDPDAKFGCASFPNQQEAFKRNFHNTLDFMKLFGCKKIHLMSGKLDSPPTKEYHEMFVSNLKYAAGFLEKENLIGVIECINHYSVPGYYLNSYSYAVDTIKAVGSNNIKLMIDLFHMQLIQGNIVNSLKDYQSHIGHIQVAQAPNRNEPNSQGELNYKFILQELEQLGYDDFIGCEYKPMTTTTDGLKWITDFGYEL